MTSKKQIEYLTARLASAERALATMQQEIVTLWTGFQAHQKIFEALSQEPEAAEKIDRSKLN